jgi:hypothetical protein
MKYMTDYQMRMDSPEVERAKRACKALYKHLIERVGREKLGGCGIGLNSSSDGPALHVRVLSEKDRGKIPEFFDSYEVLTIVSGPIVPL